MVGVTTASLANPTVRADVDGPRSDCFQQRSEIRQGCTLSPFLFILVHSAPMEDVTTLLKECRPL
eukprot:14809479-Alexandrium_andersonii.AAC.1